MTEDEIQRIQGWVIQHGLGGAAETELLDGFCERCLAAGLDLSRGTVLIDTLHPVYEGRVFRWRSDGEREDLVLEYGRTTGGEAAANWRRSVFHHLWTTGGVAFRRNLAREASPDFPGLDAMRDDGVVDYTAFVHRFAREGNIGDMDCVYSYWTSHNADGFSEPHVAGLSRLLPAFALALKCASLARIATTLVEVYLGRDAGQRVLSGKIERGVAERIDAVLWFSDLRGFTVITDTAQPDEIIPLLNDYAAVVIAAVNGAGGDVLKLIGDGILAIFRAEDAEQACRCALRAEAEMRARQALLNARRRAENLPVSSVYLGLHIGEVLFGNIGSEDRLDFTVVGPAVNEVSRIASMCRSVDRGVVMSPAFADAVSRQDRDRIVSLGRYALKGVGRAQELFTLDPGASANLQEDGSPG